VIEPPEAIAPCIERLRGQDDVKRRDQRCIEEHHGKRLVVPLQDLSEKSEVKIYCYLISVIYPEFAYIITIQTLAEFMGTENLLVDRLKTLAGSANEYEKICEYIKSSPEALEQGFNLLDYWNMAVESGDSLRILVAFGVIVRQYEVCNGLEKRTLIEDEDSEIQDIVDYGRTIAAIHKDPMEYMENGDVILDFAYTIGNYLSPISAPEILTFWPYPQSVCMLLNNISDGLIDEKIKPFIPGESRTIFGFLGLCGEMPVVLRLLDEKERINARSQWTCQLPENAEVLVLAVPDTRGYFPWDDQCSEKIKELFPADVNIRQSLRTSSVIYPGEDSLPCKRGAFVLAVVYLHHLFSNHVTSDNEETTVAFSKFLLEISLYCQYDLADDLEEECLGSDDIRLYEWSAFSLFSVPSAAAEWLENHLDNFDDNELAEHFKIGSQPSCLYSNKEEFVADIDFLFIRNLLVDAYKNSVSGEGIEMHIMTIKMLHDLSGADIPPIFKYIASYDNH